MARDRIPGRAAEVAVQAVIPPLALQQNGPQNSRNSLADNSVPAVNLRTPPSSPPSHHTNARRSSSARPASAQITVAPSTVCAPRGRTPRSPSTPPRAPFQRSRSANQASPRRTLGSLTITPLAPSTTPTPAVGKADENTAPAGAPESPPPSIPLRRKFKEKPELKDLNDVFWNADVPVVQKASKRRPHNWEEVDYYQQNMWDTDDAEYPKQVQARSTGEPEGKHPELYFRSFPQPSEGQKLKLRKDKKRGQFWVGIKASSNESLAEVAKEVTGKVYHPPGHLSEGNGNGGANRNSNKDIHPTTRLPTGSWLEVCVEDVIGQSEGAATEWAKIRSDMASLFGEIMIEVEEVDDEWEESFDMDVFDFTNPAFMREVGASIHRTFNGKALHRIEEPFVDGEPTDDLSDSGGSGGTDTGDLSDSGGSGDTDPEELDSDYQWKSASGLDPAANEDGEAALSNEEFARVKHEAKCKTMLAQIAAFPEGTGYKQNAYRLAKPRGRGLPKSRAPRYVAPGPSPLRYHDQEDPPSATSAPKRNAAASETVSMPKRAKEATKKATVPKQTADAARPAIGPKANKSLPRSTQGEDQFWEDSYDEDDFHPHQNVTYSVFNEEDDNEVTEEAEKEAERTQAPSSTTKNVLKRSRESDEEDDGDDSENEKNRAPKRPMKKRKINGSFGASDEQTSVDSATQAEFDRNTINGTDEPSSSRQQSTIEPLRSEDSDDGDMADDEDEDEDEDEDDEDGDDAQARAQREADEAYMRWLRRTSEDI